MRLLRNSVHGVLVLAAIAVALAPKAVFADADHRVPIEGTFTVATVVPSAVDHCASPDATEERLAALLLCFGVSGTFQGWVHCT